MSIHIGANIGDIAETVLLPGDALRAQWIAETFLHGARKVNAVRNAFAFTDDHGPHNKRVSVMGTGMGLSNQNIYVTELIKDYNVKRFIRVGSCGAFLPEIKLGDIILAMGACTDSGMNAERFSGSHFAPIADFTLLHQAFETAQTLNIPVQVGNIFATERFYKEENQEWWRKWVKYGVIAIEMETAELYTLAAYYGVQALTILTVSDNLVTNAQMTAEERERGFSTMVKLALTLAL
ncbi:MAG: purine-nucleoside phosphorylase [Patescibacteria group bacterium]